MPGMFYNSIASHFSLPCLLSSHQNMNLSSVVITTADSGYYSPFFGLLSSPKGSITHNQLKAGKSIYVQLLMQILAVLGPKTGILMLN